jgi:hypothetical protein
MGQPQPVVVSAPGPLRSAAVRCPVRPVYSTRCAISSVTSATVCAPCGPAYCGLGPSLPWLAGLTFPTRRHLIPQLRHPGPHLPHRHQFPRRVGHPAREQGLAAAQVTEATWTMTSSSRPAS